MLVSSSHSKGGFYKDKAAIFLYNKTPSFIPSDLILSHLGTRVRYEIIRIGEFVKDIRILEKQLRTEDLSFAYKLADVEMTHIYVDKVENKQLMGRENNQHQDKRSNLQDIMDRLGFDYLSSGSFGVVFSSQSDTSVIINFFNFRTPETNIRENMQDFLSEAELNIHLGENCISPKVLWVGLLTGYHVFGGIIVMKRFDQTLKEYLVYHTQPKDFKNVMRHLEPLWVKLERLGIFAADLKPANVVINLDKKRQFITEVRLIDWSASLVYQTSVENKGLFGREYTLSALMRLFFLLSGFAAEALESSNSFATYIRANASVLNVTSSLDLIHNIYKFKFRLFHLSPFQAKSTLESHFLWTYLLFNLPYRYMRKCRRKFLQNISVQQIKTAKTMNQFKELQEQMLKDIFFELQENPEGSKVDILSHPPI
jgi:hypothetical protein